MRILIATVSEGPFHGGTEILVEDLRSALRSHGHDVDVLTIPFQGSPPEILVGNVMATRLLDVTGDAGAELLIGVKFPAYLLRHPRKVLWLVHQYRGAFDLWSQPFGLSRQPGGANVRELIRECDRRAFEESTRVFGISKTVSGRILESTGVPAGVLYPPPRLQGCRFSAGDGGYLLYPSRVVPLKRQRLVLEALALTKAPVRVVFVGNFDIREYELELKSLVDELRLGSRVEFRGQVSQTELVDAYSGSRAVIFPPLDEDYGYVTLEAMLAAKPVVTCADSGGPLEFVAAGETGLVVEPDAQKLAAAMDRLWSSPEACHEMGQRARERYRTLEIGWDRVVDGLLS